jgi:hypothetical protein
MAIPIRTLVAHASNCQGDFAARCVIVGLDAKAPIPQCGRSATPSDGRLARRKIQRPVRNAGLERDDRRQHSDTQ